MKVAIIPKSFKACFFSFEIKLKTGPVAVLIGAFIFLFKLQTCEAIDCKIGQVVQVQLANGTYVNALVTDIHDDVVELNLENDKSAPRYSAGTNKQSHASTAASIGQNLQYPSESSV